MPARVVGAAYLLAALCLLIPLAMLGAGFAGVVLIRRGRRIEGLGAIAVGAACTVAGVTLLR